MSKTSQSIHWFNTIKERCDIKKHKKLPLLFLIQQRSFTSGERWFSDLDLLEWRLLVRIWLVGATDASTNNFSTTLNCSLSCLTNRNSESVLKQQSAKSNSICLLYNLNRCQYFNLIPHIYYIVINQSIFIDPYFNMMQSFDSNQSCTQMQRLFESLCQTLNDAVKIKILDFYRTRLHEY